MFSLSSMTSQPPAPEQFAGGGRGTRRGEALAPGQLICDRPGEGDGHQLLPALAGGYSFDDKTHLGSRNSSF